MSRLATVVLVLSFSAIGCGSKAQPATTPTPAPVPGTPPADEPAADASDPSEEAPAAAEPPRTYARSRWMIGKLNATDATTSRDDSDMENDPVFVVDAAAEKLGLDRKGGGEAYGCDYRATTYKVVAKKGGAEYEVAWWYPSPPDQVGECEEGTVRPENEPLSAASVREVDEPAGIVLWVRTDKGNKATAKKLFDSIFRKP